MENMNEAELAIVKVMKRDLTREQYLLLG